MRWLKRRMVYATGLISFAVFPSDITTSDSTDFEKGQYLFKTAGGYGCSTCHGLYAQGGGNAGGNIRGKGVGDLNIILEKEPTMKLLGPTLSIEDRRLLGVYLTELGKLNLIEWTIEEGLVKQNGVTSTNTRNQLVVLNKTFETVELDFSHSTNEKMIFIHAYETKAFQWSTEHTSVDLTQLNNELNIQMINELK